MDFFPSIFAGFLGLGKASSNVSFVVDAGAV